MTPDQKDPYALLTPQSRANPYPAYARIREAQPVYFSEGWNAWLVTRYEDVITGFRHPDLSANRAGGYAAKLPPPVREKLRPLLTNLSNWLLLLDPPAHTRIRALVVKAFSPRLVEQLRPRIEAIATGLLDAVADKPVVDLIADLANPLPVIVIGEMLGLPQGDHLRLKKWSDALAAFMGASAMSQELVAGALISVLELEAYFREQIELRKQNPGDDLLTMLCRVREQETALSEQELLSTCTVLLFGGHETTTNLIGNAVHTLLDHPDQLALLRDDPSLLANTLEEVMRYESPVQRMGRVTLADVELGGVTIPKGQRVFFVLGAANRDPDQFENPDTFDITRRSKHTTLGHGQHFCLGAALGRMEGQIALTQLFATLPAFERVDTSPTWIDNLTVRGLAKLPVRRC